MIKAKTDYNVVSYERLNDCHCCGGKLQLTGKTSSYQTFVCCSCKKRIRLNLFDNSVEVIGQVEKSNGTIRSPYNLKCAVYGTQ